MRTTLYLSVVALAAACTHQASVPPAAQPPVEPAHAQTPSERVIEPSAEAPAAPAALPRVVAQLDQTIGEKSSKVGDRFTATVVPPKYGPSALPVGTKLTGRVVKLQPAMAGSQAWVALVIDGIANGNEVEHLDAHLVGVEHIDTHTGGRPVNATGAPSAEIIGSIIPEKDLPPDVNIERSDVLGRRSVISLGTGDELHQLDKGMLIAVELRGRVPSERQAVAGRQQITSLAALATSDVDKLVGQTVELTGVPVESVIGDVVFWIGTKEQRTLIVLDKVIDTPESAIVVKAGERVTLSGVIEKTPSADVAPRLWKLVTYKEATAFEGHPFYIFAYRAKVER